VGEVYSKTGFHGSGEVRIGGREKNGGMGVLRLLMASSSLYGVGLGIF